MRCSTERFVHSSNTALCSHILQVAWLMGYPLSQTLFTSIHIDRLLWPDPKSLDESTFIRGRALTELSLSHKVLRAYCLLLIKICDCVLSIVTSQHYYEASHNTRSASELLTADRKKTLPPSFSTESSFIASPLKAYPTSPPKPSKL